MSKVDTRKLRRPAGRKRRIDEGHYEGVIEQARVKELPSNYHKSGKRTAVEIQVVVKDEQGDEVLLKDYPTLTWSSKGNWYKFLENLAMLPEPGEEFALDDLIDLKVKVKVENVTKGDKTYSNIAKMTRVEEDKDFLANL